jgi:hypothetical protein
MKTTVLLVFVLLLAGSCQKTKKVVNPSWILTHTIDSGSDGKFCSVFIKPIEDSSDSIFSSLVITADNTSDTLYMISQDILSNRFGTDIKVRIEGFFGYRFVSKNKDGFVLQALHDEGKSVSDNIWVKWNDKKKVFEVQKVP